MILPITLTMAVACVLFNIWLARRVGQMRIGHKVSIGDGGVEPLTTRMRAQANFIEWAPFFLILLGAIELAEGQRIWLWAVGLLFIVVRILHAFGMDRPPGNKFRMTGIVMTLVIMLGLSVYALVLVYQDRLERMRPVPHITYMAARAST